MLKHERQSSPSKMKILLVIVWFALLSFYHTLTTAHAEEHFNGKSYYISVSSGIWNTSNEDCALIFQPGAHLVSIETEEEQLFLNDFVADRISGGGLFWTSGAYVEGNWAWSAPEGTSTIIDQFQYWGQGEPKQPHAPHRRIAMRLLNSNSAWWETVDDTSLQRYICEVETVDSSTTTDTTLVPTEETTTTTTTTTTTALPQPIECTKTIDLVIALESSSGIGLEHFELLKDFASDLSLSFTSNGNTRLALLVFSEYVEVAFSLVESSFLDPGNITEKIREANYLDGCPLNTHTVIQDATNMIQKYLRDFPRILLVITGNQPRDLELVKEEINNSVAKGIHTFAFGVPGDVTEEELIDIGGGSQYNFIHSEEWESVGSYLEILSSRLCPKT